MLAEPAAAWAPACTVVVRHKVSCFHDILMCATSFVLLKLPLQPSTPDAVISKADAFSLHSRASATKKILLDFDGHTTTGTAWNADKGMATITSRPYDKVSTPAGIVLAAAAVCISMHHMVHASCTCRSLLCGTWSPAGMLLATVAVRITMHHVLHVSCTCRSLLWGTCCLCAASQLLHAFV
jgi:hypothetical protein